MNTTPLQANGQATTVKKIFSRTTSVAIDILASPDTIWGLLTDVAGYKSWNTTIVELTGKIAQGEKIQLRSTLAAERTFKLKVKEFNRPNRLSWGDVMGTRLFMLEKNNAGGTCFTMSETIGGPIFPLFASMIPPFDESFNQFARDLKSAAEKKI